MSPRIFQSNSLDRSALLYQLIKQQSGLFNDLPSLEQNIVLILVKNQPLIIFSLVTSLEQEFHGT